MKIFAISDLHLSTSVNKPMDVFGGAWENYWELIKKDWQSRVSAEDTVLIAGDISWGMNIDQAKADIAAISELKGTKIIIKGNHDYWWGSYSKVKNVLPDGMLALQNNALRLEGVVLAGSRGWVMNGSAEDEAIFKRELLRLEMSLEAAVKLRQDGDRLVVMTHYPPFDVYLNDSDVTRLIGKYNADAVVYGHLHGKECRARAIVDKYGVPYYLTSCDLVNNKLVEIL